MADIDLAPSDARERELYLRTAHLAKIRKLNVAAVTALGRHMLTYATTPQNEKIRNWLYPYHAKGWVDNVGRGQAGDDSRESANAWIHNSFGPEIYGRIFAVTEALNLQPYQYGDVARWISAQDANLEGRVRNTLCDRTRTVLTCTLETRRRAQSMLETLIVELRTPEKQKLLMLQASLYLALRKSGPIVEVRGMAALFGFAENGLPSGPFLTLKQPALTLPPGGMRPVYEGASISAQRPTRHWTEENWSHSSSTQPNLKARNFILNYLGVENAAAGRLLLLSRSPVLGYFDMLFSVGELVALLRSHETPQYQDLSRALRGLLDKITRSNDDFANDIQTVSGGDWKRYAPALEYVASVLKALGYDETLVDRAKAPLIKVKTKAIEHVGSALTVLGIALAFTPVGWAAIAVGGVSAAIGVGVVLLEFQETLSENEIRNKIAYGELPGRRVLELLEGSQSTDAIKRAVLVEVAFAVPDIIPVIKGLKVAIPAGTAFVKGVKYVPPPPIAPVILGPRLPTVAEHKSHITNQDRSLQSLRNEQDVLVSEGARLEGERISLSSKAVDLMHKSRIADEERLYIATGVPPRGGVDYANVNEIKTQQANHKNYTLSANELSEVRPGEIARRDGLRAEFGDAALEIQELSRVAPSSKLFVRLGGRRRAAIAKRAKLKPSQTGEAQKLDQLIAGFERDMSLYEDLVAARTRLPAMLRADVDLMESAMDNLLETMDGIAALDRTINYLRSQIAAAAKRLGDLDSKLARQSAQNVQMAVDSTAQVKKASQNLTNVERERISIQAEISSKTKTFHETSQLRIVGEEFRLANIAHINALAKNIASATGKVAVIKELAKRGILGQDLGAEF